MANSAMRELQFQREQSTNASSNVLYQAKYLPDLLQRLEKDPQSVLDDCERFRQACKYNDQYSNMVFHYVNELYCI
jgi:hypothetical protein